MTADEFLVWAEGRDGRWELFDGVPIMQHSQQWQQAEIKIELYLELRRAIERLQLPYFVAPDGPSIVVSDGRVFEPDMTVATLPKPEPRSLTIENPIIVAEVLSPSSVRTDFSIKLQGYFSVASVAHYLVVDPEERAIHHYRRSGDGITLPECIRSGQLTLDPPGLVVSLAAVFGPAE